MPTTVATREAAALAVTALGGWISVHKTDPGTTGAGEATGGSPAYARKQTTWTPGAADGVVSGSKVAIDLPADIYNYFGVWTQQIGGTFIGGGAIAQTTLNAQGQIEVTPTYTQFAA